MPSKKDEGTSTDQMKKKVGSLKLKGHVMKTKGKKCVSSNRPLLFYFIFYLLCPEHTLTYFCPILGSRSKKCRSRKSLPTSSQESSFSTNVSRSLMISSVRGANVGMYKIAVNTTRELYSAGDCGDSCNNSKRIISVRVTVHSLCSSLSGS
jgi:hypothetical protein